MTTTPKQGRVAFAALPGVARPADFGVGKWSRIATYGVKRQQQPDGSWRDFDFCDRTFAEGLRNFRRMFAGRGKGMGSDFEHQTLNAPTNGQPAPNLCYWSALAVINQAGTLVGLEDLRGDAPIIDPAAERARLADQNPAEDSDPAGTWALCSEITPLGQTIIPNYSQLSPLFNDADTDEQAQPVGLAWQNVSFVNLAFQGGTSFNFRKACFGGPTPSDSLTQGLFMAMTPELEKKLGEHGFSASKPNTLRVAFKAYMAKTADGPKERSAMAAAVGHIDDDPAADQLAKLGKFGFVAEKPETAEMAYGAYMDQTEDGPADRAAVSQAYRKMAKAKMGELVPGQSGGPGTLPSGAPSDKPPELAAPLSMGAELGPEGMAKLSKVIAPILAPLQQRVQVAERDSAAAMAKLQERDKADYAKGRAAFRKEMLEGDTARFLPEQGAQLDTLIDNVGGDLTKAREVCEIMPPVAAFQRWTRGGNPEGASSVPAPALAGLSRTQRGYAFNKAVKELRKKEPSLSHSDAQQRVAAEQPDLYEGSL